MVFNMTMPGGHDASRRTQTVLCSVRCCPLRAHVLIGSNIAALRHFCAKASCRAGRPLLLDALVAILALQYCSAVLRS